MDIDKILSQLTYSYCSCNGRLKFMGKMPDGFMEVWNELSTMEQFTYISNRTGGKCNAPRSVQFITE